MNVTESSWRDSRGSTISELWATVETRPPWCDLRIAENSVIVIGPSRRRASSRIAGPLAGNAPQLLSTVPLASNHFTPRRRTLRAGRDFLVFRAPADFLAALRPAFGWVFA